ncbi:MAG TPA: AAA family ATPase, partial [Magnetococcales bacterium]|nr:AAA family ATPase [Magnetococcales bacterium]
MYHDNFGLNQPPFRNTPDTRVFYKGGKRGAILEALEYAILQGEGIIKVVGEVGSGKTMLCRMLESRLGKKVETVFIANPSLTPENIFHAIAVELHIDVAEKNDKFQVLHSLQNDLIQKHAAGRRVVVLVEEAQGMPLATLEEIRLLSNLETSSSKLLQLVLFGQPELDVNLSVPSIRQLRERISYQFHLPPFTQEDVEEYLIMRMRSAGYRGPTPFQPGACRRICKLSGGLTRRINLLADKALLAAYIEKKDRVSTRHVNQAAAESSFTAVRDWRRTTRIATLVALIGVPLAGGLGFYLAGVNQTQPTLISPSTTPPEKPDEVTQIQVKPQPTPETQTTLE